MTLKPSEEPILNLEIAGKPIPFLVDSGATVSVLREGSVPVSLSTDTILTVGVSGLPLTEYFCDPVKVKLGDKIVKHRFIVSTHCPVNLLGRDLLGAFNLNIQCTDSGFSAASPSIGLSPLRLGPVEYSWDLTEQRTFNTLYGALLKVEWENPPFLHCVSFSSPDGFDNMYEQSWTQKIPVETVSVSYVYYDNQFAAAHVVLSEEQRQLFREPGEPHIALGKKGVNRET